MISSNTLKEIGQTLFASRSVMLFPHENSDGDAIGSCVALCTALRKHGVDSWVLVGEELPELYAFIDEPGSFGESGGEAGTENADAAKCCTMDPDIIKDPEICAFIDCNGDSRITGRENKFRQAEKTVCLDHHIADECSEDMYYIDSQQASATQIIYKLLKETSIEIDRHMANAIYTGLCSDTGNFQYSNTTAETHRIAAELFELGVDHNDIMVQLNQNVDIRQTLLESAVFPDVTYIAGGKAAIACVSQELIEKCGAKMEHADHLINVLRDTKGVEIGVVLKENRIDRIKVSFRAKSYADVSRIASEFGGGGHVRAAGCTLNTDLATAKAQIERAVEEALQKY